MILGSLLRLLAGHFLRPRGNYADPSPLPPHRGNYPRSGIARSDYLETRAFLRRDEKKAENELIYGLKQERNLHSRLYT